MTITQKCQYALRAIFELARQAGKGPVKIEDIARAQAIPARFLETILNQLRQVGFVASRRGVQGGYLLAVDPAKLTAGQVIRLIDGPFRAVDCVVGGGAECPLKKTCAFKQMWHEADHAIASVFDKTTFQTLLGRSRRRRTRRPSRARRGA
jgi:Rrf2 family protein